VTLTRVVPAESSWIGHADRLPRVSTTPEPQRSIELSDYRSAVADLYGEARDASDPEWAWRRWRARRDELLVRHPQSPFAGRYEFGGCDFFDYDPSWRVLGTVTPDRPAAAIVTQQPDGTAEQFDPIGSVRFEVGDATHVLPLYWTQGYSGGLFLPFGDATNGDTTFGSGRYLLDQAKSAFLGFDGDRLILDFNFAYHPSCVWGDWVCPLPRAESRLAVPVQAGERRPPLG